MKALEVKEDGLIYAAEVPEKPSQTTGYYPTPSIAFREYDIALASAKESAVLVSDQEKAQQIIINDYLKRGDGPPFKYHGSLVIGIGEGIYPIPDLQWDVVDVKLARVLSTGDKHKQMPLKGDVAILRECNQCDGVGTYEGGKYLETTCEACNGTGQVAILKESTPSTEPQCPFCDAKDSLTMKKETASKIKGSGLLTATFDVWECNACGESFFQHWNFNYIETNNA